MFKRFLREWMRGFHDLLRQKTGLSVHIVGIELNLNGLPNNAIYVSGFSGDNGGIVKLYAVSGVNIVFSYG
jgi:hypothetical protein